jgi:hypothetical protein
MLEMPRKMIIDLEILYQLNLTSSHYNLGIDESLNHGVEIIMGYHIKMVLKKSK